VFLIRFFMILLLGRWFFCFLLGVRWLQLPVEVMTAGCVDVNYFRWRLWLPVEVMTSGGVKWLLGFLCCWPWRCFLVFGLILVFVKYFWGSGDWKVGRISRWRCDSTALWSSSCWYGALFWCIEFVGGVHFWLLLFWKRSGWLVAILSGKIGGEPWSSVLLVGKMVAEVCFPGWVGICLDRFLNCLAFNSVAIFFYCWRFIFFLFLWSWRLGLVSDTIRDWCLMYRAIFCIGFPCGFQLPS